MIKGVLIDKPCHKNRVYINGKQISWKKSTQYLLISKTGFNWGYGGAGPQQLAFAILLELTNEKIARSLCFEFTQEFVAKLPSDRNFSVSEEKVMKIIQRCTKNARTPYYIPYEEKMRLKFKTN